MKLKISALALLASSAVLVSCSDDFLQDKQDYDKVSEDIYNYYTGANGRLAQLYQWCLPNPATVPSDAVNNTAGMNNTTGERDEQGQCTEEYTGFASFVDPQNELFSSGTRVPDYFQGQQNKIQTSYWGRVRNINDVIRGVNAGALSQEEKDEILGQAHFLRAWTYYNFVKWYGGVPIIKEVQNVDVSSVTPRSSTRECIEFILEDLELSAEMLKPFTANGGWQKAENHGRVTAGTALALKGRVLNLWASPIFNRSNDPERWRVAYEEMTKDLPVINSCGYGLAYEGNPGTNASNWAKMFNEVSTPEAVFVSLFNNVDQGAPGQPDYKKWNSWEHGLRPSNALGGGGLVPSSMIVDLFPMSDGKRPASCQTYTSLDASTVNYDQELPFVGRDPRFYRTFAFPGVRWTFDGDPTSDLNHNAFKGNVYELWNYVWYANEKDRDNIESGANYGPDGLMGNVKGFYVRKRSDDLDLGAAFYVFNNGFKQSAAPYMELRYAEVLLNYAEAACMSGHVGDAVEILKRIRRRAGYNAGEEGLNSIADEAKCMAAILYERQIELAYEGKRFDDMRRWLLFDGGTGFASIPGAPSSWTLTGWGGNTCAWLGVKPLNGQRRDNFEFRVKADINGGLGGDTWGTVNPDPLKDVVRPAAVDLRNPLDAQLPDLVAFYNTYLERNKKKGDGYTSDHVELFINFLPKYYIIGLNQRAQAANKELPQTIGWDNYNAGGANGDFDPLAEPAVEE